MRALVLARELIDAFAVVASNVCPQRVRIANSFAERTRLVALQLVRADADNVLFGWFGRRCVRREWRVRECDGARCDDADRDSLLDVLSVWRVHIANIQQSHRNVHSCAHCVWLNHDSNNDA